MILAGRTPAECTVAFMMRCTSGRHMSYVGKIIEEDCSDVAQYFFVSALYYTVFLVAICGRLFEG
jgi:hypothetical protein